MERGFIRDKVILANFRAGLRNRRNPQTGELFTEDEIARATRPGSRWYVEAQAIDDYGQGRQRNALWLVNQIRLDRASSKWLVEYHGRPRGLGDPLGATGSSGVVRVEGTPGTIIVGSTLLGSPGAYTARDPAGNLYQAFETAAIPSSGSVGITLVAISTGSSTNLPSGTVLTWVRRDPNMAPTCAVVDPFRGGTDRETDAEYLDRILSTIRHKPAAGNDAQMRAWARAASNAIEEAFVYPCAFHAGSVLVAITAKRGNSTGPLDRFPSVSTLSQAISYLVPPLSPVVPARSFVYVTDPGPETCDLHLRLGLQRGTNTGWSDPTPFPAFHETQATVKEVLSETAFVITSPGNATLPNQTAGATLIGENAPRMMLWDANRTRFVEVPAASVEDLGSNEFLVTLTVPFEGFVVEAGQVVSPDTTRRDVIAEALRNYFDELGPGQLFDIDNDPRGGRCVRFPDVTEEYSFRAGTTVATRVIEALGGSAANATLEAISRTEPSYPADLLDGPNQLVLGKVGVYAL